MPKGKKKGGSKRKVKTVQVIQAKSKAKPRMARKTGMSLDSTGVAYANMLRDPCGSRPTAFYAGTSGYVQRFSSTFAIGTTAGTTSGVLSVQPGNGGQMAFCDTATENTPLAATFTYAGSSNMPGFNFLNGSSKGFRCLAMCVKLFTNASESTRSGYIFYGNASVSETPLPGNTVAQLETMVPISARTPADCCEIKWFPGTGDTQYTTMGVNVPNASESQAVLIGWSGQPTGVGFKVMITCIWEWLPNISIGIVENAMQPSTSTSSLEEVKRALFAVNPNWWHQAGNVLFKAGKAALLTGSLQGGLIGGMRALTMG